MKVRFKAYCWALIYLAAEYIGMSASLIGAMLFIFGPILLNKGVIPHTFFNFVVLMFSIFISGGIGIALYLFCQHRNNTKGSKK